VTRRKVVLVERGKKQKALRNGKDQKGTLVELKIQTEA